MELVKNDTKKWTIIFNDENWNFDLNLISNSVTNKFHIIADFLTEMSKTCDDFDEWFRTFLFAYSENDDLRFDLMKDAVPIIKEYVNIVIDNLGTDYKKFVDETKAKKSSILFKAPEIKQIIILSGYLKVYSVISNSENLKLDQRLHKQIYNMFAADILKTDIVKKIFDVVKTKTFRYSITDRYMWDYIKTIQCKEIDDHIIEIFNFIMNNILALCENDKNPIIFFIGVIDESVKWFLRSVYKGTIIYEDSMSTEDIQSTNIDNLSAYCYNDTLGRLKGIAYELIYESLEGKKGGVLTFTDENGAINTDSYITKFQSRVMGIEYISPLCECVVFPVLSKILDIPYGYFKTISPEHAAVLSVYTYNLMRKVFKGKFKTLISLLPYYPNEQPSLTTTYVLKNANLYINSFNEIKNFLGFKNKILLHHILCHFVGRVSRIDFVHVIDGNKLGGIPLSKTEEDIIEFFIMFFSNKLENEFREMSKMANSDF